MKNKITFKKSKRPLYDYDAFYHDEYIGSLWHWNRYGWINNAKTTKSRVRRYPTRQLAAEAIIK